MRALQISAYGNPSEVLRIAEIPETGAPGAGEVLIEIELAPLNKHDLLFMRGYFGGPVAPTVVGNEGYGHVAAVGPNVKNVKVGDRVLAPNLSLTWRERLLAPAKALFPLPGGDRLQLAQLASNPPTAALILSEYTDLKPGDWIVQNGANSGVGRSLIAIAKKRGFRTINLVRRRELIDEIKQAGGDIVLEDDPASVAEAAQAVGKGAVRLAVDSVGGSATATLIQLLSDRGVLDREPGFRRPSPAIQTRRISSAAGRTTTLLPSPHRPDPSREAPSSDRTVCRPDEQPIALPVNQGRCRVERSNSPPQYFFTASTKI